MARPRFEQPESTLDHYDNTSFGGYTGTVHDDGQGNVRVWGQNQEQNRYRQLAEAAAQRQAYQVNFDAANQNLAQAQGSRGAQLEAAGMLGQAAAGNAPSRAAILGNAAAGQGLQAQLEQSAGARGGLAAAAAQAQTARQAQAAQLQAMSQFGGARSGELNDARNAYLQTGTAIRGQDYEAQGLAQKQAEAQAQSENYQRQLNQQAEMTNYQREFSVNQANLDAAIKNRAMDEQKMAIDRRNDEERTDRMLKTYAAVAQTAVMAASDERAKQDVVPLYNPPGQELRMAPSGRGYLVDDGTPIEAMTGGASLSGEPPKKSLAAAVAAKGEANRKLTPKELEAAADKAIARTREQIDRIDDQGPAVRRMGAGTPENGYNSELTSGAEKAYEAWRQRTAPWDTGRDYDLRGAYAQGLDRDGRGHLPDTFKKPNHETFSDESMYAKYAPDEAGSWDGETYKPKGPPAWLRQEQRSKDMGAALEQGLQPYAYAYKPGFDEAERQAPGEQNVGPMAQDMASNPVTATAVKEGPNGMLYIDQPKALKLSLGAAGYLAAKQREQEQRLAALEKRR
ncbi:hypothetical protein [Labilithrix luteola]|nr:hypothetical protein [Labilithrix luteola]